MLTQTVQGSTQGPFQPGVGVKSRECVLTLFDGGTRVFAGGRRGVVRNSTLHIIPTTWH
jgi:hypothetical protein